MRGITGYDSNNVNWEMVKRTQLLLREFMTVPEGDVPRTVEFMKVRAHRDDEWNNWVDLFAGGSIGVHDLLAQYNNFSARYPNLPADANAVQAAILAEQFLDAIAAQMNGQQQGVQMYQNAVAGDDQ
jgi:hypothetical protein